MSKFEIVVKSQCENFINRSLKHAGIIVHVPTGYCREYLLNICLSGVIILGLYSDHAGDTNDVHISTGMKLDKS